MEEEEYLTVQDFANRYGVQTSVIRSWVAKKLISYVLVGPRHIRHVKKSQLVKEIDPSEFGHTPTEKTEEGVEHVGPKTLREQYANGAVPDGAAEAGAWDDPVCVRRAPEEPKV